MKTSSSPSLDRPLETSVLLKESIVLGAKLLTTPLALPNLFGAILGPRLEITWKTFDLDPESIWCISFTMWIGIVLVSVPLNSWLLKSQHVAIVQFILGSIMCGAVTYSEGWIFTTMTLNTALDVAFFVLPPLLAILAFVQNWEESAEPKMVELSDKTD